MLTLILRERLHSQCIVADQHLRRHPWARRRHVPPALWRSARVVGIWIGRSWHASADSDIDVLLVVDPLPDGRTARMAEFAQIERLLAGTLVEARTRGVNTSLSPVLKTPAELAHGSPLFLDMIDDARLLIDPAGVLARALDVLRARPAALGARRIWRGNAWYWHLKPDYRPGDVFDL